MTHLIAIRKATETEMLAIKRWIWTKPLLVQPRRLGR